MACNLGDTYSLGWTVTGGLNECHIHFTMHQLGQNLIATVLCEPTITLLLPGLGWGLSNPAVVVVAKLMLVGWQE